MPAILLVIFVVAVIVLFIVVYKHELYEHPPKVSREGDIYYADVHRVSRSKYRRDREYYVRYEFIKENGEFVENPNVPKKTKARVIAYVLIALIIFSIIFYCTRYNFIAAAIGSLVLTGIIVLLSVFSVVEEKKRAIKELKHMENTKYGI